MTASTCPLWRRLLALVYDALIVLAIMMTVGLACQLATGGQLIAAGAQAVIPPWYQALQAVVVAAYFITSWRRGGQTVGMRPWQLRVCRQDGAAISLRQATLRLLVGAAPLLLLALYPLIGLHLTLWAIFGAWLVWFAVALVDPRRRALHDLAAGTEVQRVD